MWRNTWSFRLVLQLRILESRPSIARHAFQEHFISHWRMESPQLSCEVQVMMNDGHCPTHESHLKAENNWVDAQLDKPQDGVCYIVDTPCWNGYHSWWRANVALRDEFFKKAEAYCANKRRKIKLSEALPSLMANVDCWERVYWFLVQNHMLLN